VSGLNCRVAVSNAGILLGVPGPYGARVAWLRGLGSSAPEWALTLGDTDAATEAAPAVCVVQSSAHAAFVEQGVAKRIALPTGKARVVAEGVRRVAMGSLGRDSYVITAGSDLRLHSSEPAIAAVTLVARCESLAALEVVSLRGSVLVLYAPEGSSVLGVCRWNGDSVRVVRHPSRAPILELHAQVSGESAGLALGYGDDGVDFARVDADGQMLERPHPRLRGYGARLTSPSVVWVESAFGLAASARGGVRFEGLRDAEALRVPEFTSPCRVAYQRSRLVLLAAEQAGGVAKLRVLTQDRAGERRQEHVHALAPQDESRRRRRSALRDSVSELVSLSRAGGRDGAPLRLLASGLGVWFSTPERSLRLELACLERGVRLRVSSADEREEEPPPEPSLLRLSRWVRCSLGMAERPRSAAQEALVSALTRALPEAVLGALHCVGGAFEVNLTLPAGPSLDQLLQVLLACRQASSTSSSTGAD